MIMKGVVIMTMEELFEEAMYDNTAKLTVLLKKISDMNEEERDSYIKAELSGGNNDVRIMVADSLIGSYKETKDCACFDEGIKWLLLAIENGSVAAYNTLSRAYRSKNDYENYYKYAVEGAELGAGICMLDLALEYLRDAKHYEEGIILCRKLIRRKLYIAKYLLAICHYRRYANVITKASYFNSNTEWSLGETLLGFVPYVNLVAIPFLTNKKEKEQLKKQENLSHQDKILISEMVRLFNELMSDPGDLGKRQRKVVRTYLKSIKDEYK